MSLSQKNSVSRLFLKALRHPDLRASRHVLIAVSGGVDSMVLLHLCQSYLKIKFSVAHFNHSTRGKESDGDEARVKTYAKQNRLDFFSGRRKSKKPVSETWLRKDRLGFLEKTAKEIGADFIFTAHHLDDQLETFFMRLMRGTGLKGLTAIPVRREMYFRPLLEIPKDEISGWAVRHKISYSEDHTNRNNTALRNRIRNQLVPTFFATMNQHGDPSRFYARLPALLSDLKGSHDRLQKLDQSWIRHHVRQTEFWDLVSLEKLRTLPPAKRGGVIRQIFSRSRTETPTRKVIARIERWLKNPTRHLSIEGKMQISHSCGAVFFRSANQMRHAELRPSIAVIEDRFEIPELGFFAKIHPELREHCEFRYFEAGDRIRTTKVKKLLNSLRVPAPLRPLTPVIYDPLLKTTVWFYPQSHPLIQVEKAGVLSVLT